MALVFVSGYPRGEEQSAPLGEALLAQRLLQDGDEAEGLPVWEKGRRGTGNLILVPTAAAAGNM